MPPILVTKPSLPSFEEYTSLIQNIWDNRWLTNSGPLHNQLQNNLAAFLNLTKENISLFTNGHQALEAALHALNLPKGSEVITTPYTFASTTHAIVRSGLTPVFCDISYEDYNIDVTKIEELITEKTSAILPVHVYGTPCNVDKIQEIADRHGLKVIYDAAHAFGVTLNGRALCSFGDASMLSFHATKVFNTVEGGAVCYSDPAVGDKLHCLRNFGILDQETVSDVGANAKMNEFQAAMGLCNLRHIEEEIAKRKAVCDRYRMHLENKEGIKLCTIPSDVTHNYAYFPVVFDETKLGKTRNDIFTSLANENIFARKYFYTLVQDYDCYKDRYSSDSTPTAKYIADRVLTLPLYADLPLEEVDRICRIILQA